MASVSVPQVANVNYLLCAYIIDFCVHIFKSCWHLEAAPALSKVTLLLILEDASHVSECIKMSIWYF